MQVKDIKGEADYNEVRQIIIDRVGQNVTMIHDVLDAFWDVIAEALAIHDRVELHGIGAFKLVDRKEDSGLDPQGRPWETPERREIVFQPSDAYAEKVKAFTGEDTPII